MKLKLTDIERIKKHKCETKGCDSKARCIFNQEYFCEDCFDRKCPKKSTGYFRTWRRLFKGK